MTDGRSLIAARAGALALAAASSLGLARFSYALLLQPMRSDLGWNYFVAGAMNTVNAAGYLAGALLMQRWLHRHDARKLLLIGGYSSAALLAAHGLVLHDAPLLVLRALTGVSSAMIFVAGALMAASLAESARHLSSGKGAGLVLGVYYGGTGIGIIVSALVVPPLSHLPHSHAWQEAWFALGAVALLFACLTAFATRGFTVTPLPLSERTRFQWQTLSFGLAGYLMFGLGYIGYMTFIITLLREQRVPEGQIVAFYALLGAGVIASSWIWAGLLQRARGGGALALLNGLLAIAAVLPVLSTHVAVLIASAALFGCVFLSVVASTTAMVRHNVAPSAWAAGISFFTVMFAAGQIVGPSLVGWLADGPGGLPRGFVCSALVLAVGALLATAQRPVGHSSAAI